MPRPLPFLLIVALPACTSSMLAARVEPELGVARYAPLPADSVRVVRLSFQPDWQLSLGDSLAGPYEELASIETLGVGRTAADDALAALRRRVGETGGNVAAVLYVRADPVPPYTRAAGQALRTLPPMPDAAARCARLDAVGSDSVAARVAARVAACREAARLAPSDPAPLRDLALAFFTLSERGAEQRKPAGGVASAYYGARWAIRHAGRLDSAFAAPAPYVPGVVRLVRGDSLRAFRQLGWLLEGAGWAEGSLAAFREVMRIAPDSADGYDDAVTMLLRLKRPEEALRVAGAFARRHPERVEGWARAGVAANVMGDHVRAMRFFGRVLQVDPKYFGAHWVEPYGMSEYRGSKKRAGEQPPATLEELDE